MTESGRLAPELDISEWLNTPEPLTLAALRGQVVVLHAFQMLCPGCVLHGLPQAQALQERLGPLGVRVIGLHTVFEHQAVMTPAALRAFVHEYRLTFPIGVDRPVTGQTIPATMAAYALQGTPSLVVIDRQGRIRQQAFGRVDDLALGVLLGQLLAAPGHAVGGVADSAPASTSAGACGAEHCSP